MRGVIPALLLEELEKRSGKRVHELFDIVAGTSTGALLALGLTCPARDSTMPATAGQLVSIYDQLAGKVFPRDEEVRAFLRRMHLIPYDVQALRRVTGEFLSGYMSDALTDVLVMAYDLQMARAVTLSSWGARDDARHDLECLDAACGACAAPTVFKPVTAESRAKTGPTMTLMDAGVFANNPTMVAVAAALRRWPGRRLIVVSLGTGDVDAVKPESAVAAPGLGFWKDNILDIAGDGASQIVDEQVGALVSDDSYWRLQPGLPQDHSRLDDSSADYIHALKVAANNLIRSKSGRLDAIVGALG